MANNQTVTSEEISELPKLVIRVAGTGENLGVSGRFAAALAARQMRAVYPASIITVGDERTGRRVREYAA